MWETRSEESEHNALTGKFLAVFPDTQPVTLQNTFFTNAPARQTRRAVAQTVLRTLQ